MDQVSVKKVASLAFLLVIMLLMALPLALAPAPPLMKSNNNGTTLCYNNGFLREEEEGKESCHHIANDYLDMEFMMGSGISRSMLDVKPPSYLANKVLYPKMPAVCDRKGQPYRSCYSGPARTHNPPPQRCFGIYNINRNCPP